MRSSPNYNHIDVVITQATPIFSDSHETCLTNARVPDLESSQNVAFDDETYARYPLLFSASTASKNRRVTACLTALVEQGLLTPRNKIGVIIEDCPYNQRT